MGWEQRLFRYSAEWIILYEKKKDHGRRETRELRCEGERRKRVERWVSRGERIKRRGKGKEKGV
jgi:hypothetical protein